MQQRQIALGDPRGVIKRARRARAEQDLLHRQPHPRRVAVARQVHEARDEPSERVLADEQPHLTAQPDAVHGGDRSRTSVSVSLENSSVRGNDWITSSIACPEYESQVDTGPFDRRRARVARSPESRARSRAARPR